MNKEQLVDGLFSKPAGDKSFYLKSELKPSILVLLDTYSTQELVSELKSIQNFNKTIGNSLPWELGVGKYIEGRIEQLSTTKHNTSKE